MQTFYFCLFVCFVLCLEDGWKYIFFNIVGILHGKSSLFSECLVGGKNLFCIEEEVDFSKDGEIYSVEGN